ncbi:hypothetical protein ARTSIC4J27_1050 [Pseudarthrobacter siccitolerans]|uniref:Uncharacterized protein n=1 Tax=Pseudarthrobacter siccitolerans TaxID=861266 RepID=A0A024GZR1_9MICC|nr:hypothetical protein ARTSIC4J27_1050 [Pseudarthrobacter siccitolerans]
MPGSVRGEVKAVDAMQAVSQRLLGNPLEPGKSLKVAKNLSKSCVILDALLGGP